MITACLNTKIGEVENKIPNVSGLLNKTAINKKYCTTSDYNNHANA